MNEPFAEVGIRAVGIRRNRQSRRPPQVAAQLLTWRCSGLYGALLGPRAAPPSSAARARAALLGVLLGPARAEQQLLRFYLHVGYLTQQLRARYFTYLKSDLHLTLERDFELGAAG